MEGVQFQGVRLFVRQLFSYSVLTYLSWMEVAVPKLGSNPSYLQITAGENIMRVRGT